MCELEHIGFLHGAWARIKAEGALWNVRHCVKGVALKRSIHVSSAKCSQLLFIKNLKKLKILQLYIFNCFF